MLGSKRQRELGSCLLASDFPPKSQARSIELLHLTPPETTGTFEGLDCVVEFLGRVYSGVCYWTGAHGMVSANKSAL